MNCAYSIEISEANMDVFTVSLFGHRDIDALCLFENQLDKLVRKLISEKEYVKFLIGRNGEFDELAASIIKRAQRELGKENNDITLVLPYSVSNIEFYEKYYDDIIIPENVCCAHPKIAITLKNRWMVDRSDLVIAYVERDNGGAYTAMRYAKKINVDVINIYELD